MALLLNGDFTMGGIMKKAFVSLFVSAALALSLLVAGAVAGFAKEPPRNKVVVGIINPTTGVLAGFGEGTPWAEKQVVDYVNNTLGGIYFKEYDRKLPLEIIIYDSESDTTKCTQLAQKLIQEDKIDLMVVRHTPETTNPVNAVCERFKVPCLSLDGPVDAFLAEGPYEWTYHVFWNLDAMFATYASIWKQAGFGKGTKIGLLFENDADGTAWHNKFPGFLRDSGFTVIDPGQFPPLTQDFSSIIRLFMKEGVEIVSGCTINPDFATFWRQCKQLGYQPKFITMAKAYLLESDARAIGPDLMDGLTCEVWWSPTHPWKSALTGETPASLGAKYKAATGRTIPQPVGIKYTSMELAYDVLSRAGSLDKAAIRDAIAATDLETVFCRIKYNADRYALTPLVGGQWVKNAQGGLDILVIDNGTNPDIPTNAKLKPLK